MQGYKIPVRPKLSGLRILSLDGGGVRGIIQTAALQRLESLIGLNLPIGQFFDLIVGTSAGNINPMFRELLPSTR
jgi:patatin-like phospholipase/acyl hydrolase